MESCWLSGIQFSFCKMRVLKIDSGDGCTAMLMYLIILEKTRESPLDSKEIKLVNAKGNQAWIFFGRTDAEAEAPILWPPDAKSQLIGKDPDAGKDWGQEENGAAMDEMVGWHHQLHGHEFEQTLRDGEGKGSLLYYSPWDCKKSDTTDRQNNWTTASSCKKEPESSWKR